jgi:hypothetical protein
MEIKIITYDINRIGGRQPRSGWIFVEKQIPLISALLYEKQSY